MGFSLHFGLIMGNERKIPRLCLIKTMIKIELLASSKKYYFFHEKFIFLQVQCGQS